MAGRGWTFGVNFIARTSTFGRDVGKARSAMHSFNSSIIGVQATLRRYARALLATAGMYGIGYMIKQQMEAVHEAGELAKRLGVTTEALTGLQHAAKMSGVEQETLNASLEKFNRKLGEAQSGSASARSAFAQIGVSFRDLIGMSPDKQFGLIADQINRLGTQSQKAAAIQEIFGRGSASLLNLFSEGSKGIAAYQEEAKKLGLTFDQFDAAKADMAVRALIKLKAVFTGIFRETAIQLAPYIEAASNAFTRWATEGQGVGSKITAAFEAMTLGAVRFGAEVAKLNNRWLEMKAVAADVVSFWEDVSPLGRINAIIRERRGVISPTDLASQYRSQKTDLDAQVNKVKQFYDDINQRAEKAAGEGKAFTGFTFEQQRETQWDQYLEKLRDDMDNWSLYIEDRWGDMASSIEGSTGNMFASMIKDGGNWRDVMSNYFNDIASAASQMAGQTTARALFGSILGNAGNTTGGAPLGHVPAGMEHEGGIIGEGGGIRRNMPASAFMMAPRFHSGLRADEFTAILQRGEQVIPKGGGKGGVTINVQTPDVTATQRWLWNNRHSLADMVSGAGRENNKVRRMER